MAAQRAAADAVPMDALERALMSGIMSAVESETDGALDTFASELRGSSETLATAARRPRPKIVNGYLDLGDGVLRWPESGLPVKMAPASLPAVLSDSVAAGAKSVELCVPPEDARWSGVGESAPEIAAVLDRVPLTNPDLPAGLFPTPRAVSRSLSDAELGAKFRDETFKVVAMDASKLLPSESTMLTARADLVERYRKSWPVDPPVVDQTGVILDGHHRVASAAAAGRQKIVVVVVQR